MLRVRTVQGYRKGEPFPLKIIKIDNKWMGIDTGLQWIRMLRAAGEDGIRLRLNSAFRSNEEQTRLYEERKDPAVRAKKGGAARPGYSNHQAGDALDIRTGMGAGDPNKKPRSQWTKTFAWLDQNAKRFGFARTVSREPWHHVLVQTVERADLITKSVGGVATVVALAALVWLWMANR